MKSHIVMIVLLLLLIASVARSDVVTVSTTGSSIAITNDQSNFVWTPTAVIYSRTDAIPVTLSIHRYGNGQPVLLSFISATASNLIWLPTARYVFTRGSALVVSSSATNFSIQLHREPAHE